ncbi:MAG: T9SS type A sorting domain-containing protein [Bacteroidota bacterium]
MKNCALTILALFIAFLVQSQTAAPCFTPTAFGELNINNVRTIVSSAGNFGRDRTNGPGGPGYEVPKGSGIHPIFDSGFWIAGTTESGIPLASGQVYRQSGVDFWPGPISDNGAIPVEGQKCEEYDRVWSIYRWEVDRHRLYFDRLEQDQISNTFTANQFPFQNGYRIPEDIIEWPAHGEVSIGESWELAPYIDRNDNGYYDPEKGDYPAFYYPEFGLMDIEYYLLGDQITWTIYNDIAQVQSQSGGEPVKIEVHEMRYAFYGSEHLSNSTFSRHKIESRNSQELKNVSFAYWTDTDLGCFGDDYIGCDVQRDLGYSYNGDLLDENCSGSLGYGTELGVFGVDILKGPKADHFDGMDNDKDGIVDESNEFCSMNRFIFPTGDIFTELPYNDQTFYNYTIGKWNHGLPITFGNFGTSQAGIPCRYFFPGETDPFFFGTNGIDPGFIWTEEQTGSTPSDRRFVQTSGPFTLAYGKRLSIHKAFVFSRKDSEADSLGLIKFFEADDQIQDYFDSSFENLPCQPVAARFEKEQRGKVFDFAYPYEAAACEWNFGDGRSANGRFASHKFRDYGFFEICMTVENCGESLTYCDSIYISPSLFMQPIALERISGQGNGGNELCIEGDRSSLFSEPYFMSRLQYKAGHSPINVYVPDPLCYVPGDYALAFDSVGMNSNWKLWKVGEVDTIYSQDTLGIINNQFIPEYGIMVSAQQFEETDVESVLPIHFSIEFEDEEMQWLDFIPDKDGITFQNWIKSGAAIMDDLSSTDIWEPAYNDYSGKDNTEIFENNEAKGWSPFYMSARNNAGPSSEVSANNLTSAHSLTDHQDLHSFELVLTPDKSKWSRSIVFELCDEPDLSFGNAVKLTPRLHPSKDIFGNSGTPEATMNGAQEFGMSWFPGYAVDLETGLRLNIAFGENSWLAGENGYDMLWNPTTELFNQTGEARFGGMHYIYLFRSDSLKQMSADRIPHYDASQLLYEYVYLNPSSTNFRRAFRAASWVGLPILNEGYEMLPIEEGLIPTETRIRVNVAKPYAQFNTNDSLLNKGMPLYYFSLEDGLNGIYIQNEIEDCFDIYPNPSSGNFTLDLRDLEDGIWRMEMYNEKGQKVRSEELMQKIEQFQFDLSAGLYLVFISNAERILCTKKIVIR